MKKMNLNLLWLLVAILSLGVFSCKDDEEEKADKTALAASITAAEAVYDAAEVGKLAGQYTQASVDAFLAAINAAKAVNDDDAATQVEVDATVSNLDLAVTTFEATVIVEISVENLVAYWKLAGDGVDASGNGHDGTLKAGTTARWPDAGDPPQAATDRYGTAGGALHFAHGANIEVPYSADFNPDDMTISVWLNTDSLWTSRTQYIMSNNIWDCWKFELPNHGKPYITRKLSDETWIDKDANPVALEAGNWYQVVVTHGDGHVIFYVNGVLAVDWDDIGTAAPVAADPSVNLVIGSFKPNDLEWTVETWFTSFHGSLDDIRIYDKALTAAEVTALYTMESVD
jgi:hypothetical protein